MPYDPKSDEYDHEHHQKAVDNRSTIISMPQYSSKQDVENSRNVESRIGYENIAPSLPEILGARPSIARGMREYAREKGTEAVKRLKSK